MFSNLCSIFIIGIAAWMFTSDPLHRFHHAPVRPAPVAAHIVLPVKRGTTGAMEWKRVLQDADAMLMAQK
jgi:hypothetical protein